MQLCMTDPGPGLAVGRTGHAMRRDVGLCAVVSVTVRVSSRLLESEIGFVLFQCVTEIIIQ